MEQGTTQIESASQFKNTPTGLAKRWNTEIQAAKENQKAWWNSGQKVVQRYLDERNDGAARKSRLNLFHSDVNTFRSMLLGRLPQVDVDRRHQDAKDDEARVGADMLERLLNTDIERDDDGYVASLKYAIEDWTLPGLGVARVRYDNEDEEVETPAKMKTRANPDTGEEEEYEAAPAFKEIKRTREDVETYYVYWKDFLWSPARTWHEVRWVAFKVEMTKDQVAERFGKKMANLVPLKNRTPVADKSDDHAESADALKQVWSRADVWEIWDKDNHEVLWLVEGMDRILDRKPDPYGLQNFFPCPRPLIANATTTKLIPKPDFEIARDLYDEIDELTARISLLQKAAKVVGVYDATQEEIPRLVDEACENDLIPVESMLQLSEKGGLQAVVQFMPLDTIVVAIEKLTLMRSEKIAMLHQVTGLSDILRGQAEQKATATEQRIKAGAASTRVQTSQDEVARFASDLQKLRAEIIAKHYDPQTIIEKSNIERTGDARMALAAVKLIKDKMADYRIQVRPESISLPDLAAQKQQGIELMQAFGGFVPVLLQAGQAMPQSVPFLLELWQWIMAKFPGSSGVENVFDRMINAAQQAAQKAAMTPPPPDPKMEAVKVKADAEAKGAQAKLQQTVVEAQTHIAKSKMDMQKDQASFGMDMAEMKAKQEMAAQVQAFGGAHPVPAVTGGVPT